jgi:hypothetical protein
LGVHRDVGPGALAELLDVDVAGGLPGRDGPQGLGGVGGSFACGDTASGLAWAVTKNRVSPDFSSSIRLGGLIAGAG